jgi:hypothetical protein
MNMWLRRLSVRPSLSLILRLLSQAVVNDETGGGGGGVDTTTQKTKKGKKKERGNKERD